MKSDEYLNNNISEEDEDEDINSLTLGPSLTSELYLASRKNSNINFPPLFSSENLNNNIKKINHKEIDSIEQPPLISSPRIKDIILPKVIENNFSSDSIDEKKKYDTLSLNHIPPDPSEMQTEEHLQSVENKSTQNSIKIKLSSEQHGKISGNSNNNLKDNKVILIEKEKIESDHKEIDKSDYSDVDKLLNSIGSRPIPKIHQHKPKPTKNNDPGETVCCLLI